MKSEQTIRFVLDLLLCFFTVLAFVTVLLGWNWILHG